MIFKLTFDMVNEGHDVHVTIEHTLHRMVRLVFIIDRYEDHKPEWFGGHQYISDVMKHHIYEMCKIFKNENLCAREPEISQVSVTFAGGSMIVSKNTKVIAYIRRKIEELSIEQEEGHIYHIDDGSQSLVWRHPQNYTMYMGTITDMIDTIIREGTLSTKKQKGDSKVCITLESDSTGSKSSELW